MKWYWVTPLILALTAAAAICDDDDDRGEFRARLSPFEQVPTLSTTGSGEFRASLSGSGMSMELQYRLMYSGLEGGSAIAAHIHLGARATNGGIVAFLCGGGGKPACPATAGTVEGTIRAADIVPLPAQGITAGEFAEVIRAMRAGVTYVNVHTPTYPGGEIRGQVRRH